MYTTIVILIVLASVVMCLIVLIQESKGGGLAADYASGNQLLGAPKTSNVIEKATWTLAIVVCVLSILTAFVAPRTLVQGGSRVSNAPKQEQTATPFATQQQAPAAPAQPAK